MASVTMLDSVVKDPDKQLGTATTIEKNPLPSSSVNSHVEKLSKPQRMSDFMDAIQKFRGFEGALVMDRAGKLGKSSFDDATSSLYCGVSSEILRAVVPLIQKHSPKNTLHTIRTNGGGKELIIAPIINHDLTFVILQHNTDLESMAENCLKPVTDKRHKHKKRGSLTGQPRPSTVASTSGAGAGRATIASAPSSKPPSQKPPMKSRKSGNPNASISN